jgi:hypothetical protein
VAINNWLRLLLAAAQQDMEGYLMVPNSLPNFETSPKSIFGKSGVFETGPCGLGSGFETGATERALNIASPLVLVYILAVTRHAPC